jgi:hypothetical protein
LRHWRIGGLVAGIAAGSLLVVVGCTNVKPGNPTVDTKEAPDYRTSVSLSLSASAASSSEAESSALAASTTQAVHTSCDTLKQTGGAAVTAVNDYVNSLNAHASDTGSKEAPAINALRTSADQVTSSLSPALSQQLTSALQGYADSARAVADSISKHDSPDVFNGAVDKFNTAKTNALNQCNSAS